MRLLSDEYTKSLISNGRRVGTDTFTDILEQEDTEVSVFIEENPQGDTVRGELVVTIPLTFLGAIEGLKDR